MRPKIDGVGPRLETLRCALGARGDETPRRAFARELGVNEISYYRWEARGAFPGRAILSEALARLKSVVARGLDARALAAWVEQGNGDPPLSPADVAQPVRGDDLSAVTPWRNPVALAHEVAAFVAERAQNLVEAKVQEAKILSIIDALRATQASKNNDSGTRSSSGTVPAFTGRASTKATGTMVDAGVTQGGNVKAVA